VADQLNKSFDSNSSYKESSDDEKLFCERCYKEFEDDNAEMEECIKCKQLYHRLCLADEDSICFDCNEPKEINMKENKSVAVQIELYQSIEGTLIIQEDHDMSILNESDHVHSEEHMPLAVQNVKNKGGRPKKLRRKKPITWEGQAKRIRNQRKLKILKD